MTFFFFKTLDVTISLNKEDDSMQNVHGVSKSWEPYGHRLYFGISTNYTIRCIMMSQALIVALHVASVVGGPLVDDIYTPGFLDLSLFEYRRNLSKLCLLLFVFRASCFIPDWQQELCAETMPSINF